MPSPNLNTYTRDTTNLSKLEYQNLFTLTYLAFWGFVISISLIIRSPYLELQWIECFQIIHLYLEIQIFKVHLSTWFYSSINYRTNVSVRNNFYGLVTIWCTRRKIDKTIIETHISNVFAFSISGFFSAQNRVIFWQRLIIYIYCHFK